MDYYKKKTKSDYEKYIKTEELLTLQKPEQDLSCQDELTFQTIHQIAELHFKLMIQYIHIAHEHMTNGEVDAATDQIRRVNMHLDHLPNVFDMVKVISPNDYHTIRLALGQGSGQDSPGFNEVLRLGPTLWEPFDQILQTHHLTPLAIHQQPEAHPSLFNLMQSMIRFDENFQSFRHQHLQLVRRMIGLQTNSLKGIPAQMLEKGVKYEFYPKLWESICALTDWTGSSYDTKPLE
ncbi:tryptophan 2,3-dioxygenase family protein [Pontibacillus yanchengensis]|uniref:Tryptophan 2,3-dioxygenase n=1 Tax=Pontibacillus yanchengensis Y32 TaxID=1385514 RepID=A0A0A2T5Y0_9BACI|nr:tryptophan 2,3-dioxygenase family protein [Pontibacillus yanchengensis]KGP70859.1 tryptophan 2,3-dioxygenase [Pontibacillus yanchengensis Y32]